MSEEPNSPQPDIPLKTEDTGAQADAKPSAGIEVAGGAGDSAGSGADSTASAGDGKASASGAEDAAAIPSVAKFEGDISMRRSPWKSSWAAIQYVQGAAKTDHIQIRTSDRVTIIALLFFCIAEVLSLVWAPLHGFRFAFMCCCDIILGTCTVLFLVYRIGILSALNTRQAMICWQMMMGCVFLGIFLCLNTILAIAYLVETFFPNQVL